ncbi:MAG TPA: hypothetical protein EYH54_05450 [Nautiliaceae bacterium]|nr:hypothetical protein [Nautiliaceae bacterium]
MDKNFYTIDGKTLSNLEDLINYIKISSNDIFIYHKEHFAKWLIDVFGDCKTAFKLRFSKNKEDFLIKMSK